MGLTGKQAGRQMGLTGKQAGSLDRQPTNKLN